VLEFVPPLPQTDFDRAYSAPEFYSICGDDRCEADEPKRIPFEPEHERAAREKWYDGFFDSPCCEICRISQGLRNDRPLNLTYVGKYDGGFVGFAGSTLRVYSEAFLMLLSAAECSRLRFKRVERNKKARKQYFELIGPAGPPYVAIRNVEFSGWECPSCKARSFGHWSETSAMTNFVARADLPQPMPEVFTIGPPHSLALCVTADRWAQMVGQRGTRGMVSMPIGVVPDDEVDRAPQLPPREV
jgi:hypothetical protein